MRKILRGPFTHEERNDFIVEHAMSRGLKAEEYKGDIYILEMDESMVNGDIVKDTSYYDKQRLLNLNAKINRLKEKLKKLDLKTIRALREGGTLETGQTYLDFYQEQINEVRCNLRELIEERNNIKVKMS